MNFSITKPRAGMRDWSTRQRRFTLYFAEMRNHYLSAVCRLATIFFVYLASDSFYLYCQSAAIRDDFWHRVCPSSWVFDFRGIFRVNGVIWENWCVKGGGEMLFNLLIRRNGATTNKNELFSCYYTGVCFICTKARKRTSFVTTKEKILSIVHYSNLWTGVSEMKLGICFLIICNLKPVK